MPRTRVQGRHGTRRVSWSAKSEQIATVLGDDSCGSRVHVRPANFNAKVSVLENSAVAAREWVYDPRPLDRFLQFLFFPRFVTVIFVLLGSQVSFTKSLLYKHRPISSRDHHSQNRERSQESHYSL